MNFARFVVLSAVVVGCGVEKIDQEPIAPANPIVPVTPEAPVQTDELPALPDRAPEIFAPTYRRAAGVEAVDFDALLANPGNFTGRLIETGGVVRASCQVRGCWMEVRSVRDAKSNTMTVRFVNYSFFVPLESRSADVRFQGFVKLQTITPAQVAEYESEGLSFGTKNADGSVTQVGFTANGVEMWRKQ